MQLILANLKKVKREGYRLHLDQNRKPNPIPYMREYIDISEGYTYFYNWVSSNGALHTEWYHNLSGYRDNNKLYSK